MKSLKKIICLLAIFVFAACSTVPITGRKQMSLIPNTTLLPMSFNQYSQFLTTNAVSKNATQTKLVKDVGVRIQKAVESYMKENGLEKRLKGYNWEFNLVEDITPNAWAMPGGKVVFYTGILPITKDANGLAVVMGHEIAHAIAGHGNERMSQGLLTQAGQVGLAVYMKDKPVATQNMMMAAYGLGSQVGVTLPFSRMHESEADRLGLIFMAMAGYDINEAPKFWERMDKLSGGKTQPEFFSTHPSSSSRIAALKKHIPEAKKYFRPYKG